MRKCQCCELGNREQGGILKPILFNSEMVKAILDGRKTMTRRIIQPQPKYWGDGVYECPYPKHEIIGPEMYSPIKIDKNGDVCAGDEVFGIYSLDGEYGCKSPYSVGDVLWVRETWSTIGEWTTIDPETGCFDGYIYKADWDSFEHPKWHPSIHMPLEAARLFLRVTNVRAERVQDISRQDCEREGMAYTNGRGLGEDFYNAFCLTPFMSLWNDLYGKRGYGWDKNPWIWVIEFECIKEGAE